MIIYCRVSTKGQAENYSLQDQLASCRRDAASKGWTILAEFIEPGASAKTIDRPQFQRMMKYCAEHRGKVRHLLVYRVDRFTRSNADFHSVTKLLVDLGVQLHSATEAFEDTPTGRWMAAMLAATSQLDNDNRAIKSTTGMQSALARGRWPYAPPTGFRKGPDPYSGPTLVEDPQRGRLVHDAFLMVATGSYNLQEVRKAVTQRGLRSRKGRPLSTQTFSDMLRNELYAGWMVVRSWDIRQRGEFIPLVTEETFRDVQRVLKVGARSSLLDFDATRIFHCGDSFDVQVAAASLRAAPQPTGRRSDFPITPVSSVNASTSRKID